MTLHCYGCGVELHDDDEIYNEIDGFTGQLVKICSDCSDEWNEEEEENEDDD